MKDEFFQIQRSDVQSWTSTSVDRIHIPYAVTGDVLLHVSMMLADTLPQPDPDTDEPEDADAFLKELDALTENAAIAAELQLLPYPRLLLAGLHITVWMPDGTVLRRTLSLNEERNEPSARAVASEFFRRGGAGLNAAFQRYWNKSFQAYLARVQG